MLAACSCRALPTRRCWLSAAPRVLCLPARIRGRDLLDHGDDQDRLRTAGSVPADHARPAVRDDGDRRSLRDCAGGLVPADGNAGDAAGGRRKNSRPRPGDARPANGGSDGSRGAEPGAGALRALGRGLDALRTVAEPLSPGWNDGPVGARRNRISAGAGAFCCLPWARATHRTPGRAWHRDPERWRHRPVAPGMAARGKR